MEDDGIISRKVFPAKPPKVEYSLSELGMSLKPLLLAMEDWGKFYKSKIEAERV